MVSIDGKSRFRRVQRVISWDKVGETMRVPAIHLPGASLFTGKDLILFNPEDLNFTTLKIPVRVYTYLHIYYVLQTIIHTRLKLYLTSEIQSFFFLNFLHTK